MEGASLVARISSSEVFGFNPRDRAARRLGSKVHYLSVGTPGLIEHDVGDTNKHTIHEQHHHRLSNLHECAVTAYWHATTRP